MPDSLYRIFALTWKELLSCLKDPRSRFSLLIPPIMQCLIFGYAATYDLNDVPYVLIDQDRSAASHELVARIESSGTFRRVATVENPDDMRALIDTQQALMVIQIGQDFERRLLSGAATEIQVAADGRNSNSAGTAVSYVNAVVTDFNAKWRERRGMPKAPIEVTLRAWFNSNLETRWNIIPGLIGTLTMMQTLLLTAMSVAREREQGTFDQLLVTPFRPIEIMAGKALPSILIGLVQATSVLLVAQLWFAIPFVGSFVTLYVGLTLFVLAAVGIGLLISSVVGTMQQAMLFSFMLVLPFSILSGLMTSIKSMPEFLQWLTIINPLRYATELVHRVYLEGAPLAELVGVLWPLALISAVTLSGAAWMFRNRLA